MCVPGGAIQRVLPEAPPAGPSGGASRRAAPSAPEFCLLRSPDFHPASTVTSRGDQPTHSPKRQTIVGVMYIRRDICVCVFCVFDESVLLCTRKCNRVLIVIVVIQQEGPGLLGKVVRFCGSAHVSHILHACNFKRCMMQRTPYLLTFRTVFTVQYTKNTPSGTCQFGI